MAIRFIIEQSSEFATKFEFSLNLLVTAFSKNEKIFNKIYQEILPSWYKKEIYKLILTNKFKGTEYEEVQELAKEVYYYYYDNYVQYKNITFRDPNELNEFEVFIDLLLQLKEKSEYQFFLYFSHSPAIYWDKIDDLRENSIKRERDSVQYIRCLEKAKYLTYCYDDLCEKYNNYKKLK